MLAAQALPIENFLGKVSLDPIMGRNDPKCWEGISEKQLSVVAEKLAKFTQLLNEAQRQARQSKDGIFCVCYWKSATAALKRMQAFANTVEEGILRCELGNPPMPGEPRNTRSKKEVPPKATTKTPTRKKKG